MAALQGGPFRVPAHPEASSPSVSRRMAVQARRDTLPEVQVRRLLHASGLRYRVNLPVPGRSRRTIDIAFTRRKLAIFIDGCFWHSCPEHRTSPRANNAWWAHKLESNVLRDADTTTHLKSLGWTVLRFWEHESPFVVADEISAALDATGVGGIPDNAAAAYRGARTGSAQSATTGTRPQH